MVKPPLDYLDEDSKARFWAKVDKRTPLECWNWTGTVNRDGYATQTIQKHSRRCTHIALVLDGRPRPFPKAEACHRCDNPTCVNPHHLWWGTHQENVADGGRKGRWSRPLHHRVSRHHINLMNMPEDRLPREARKWRVSVEHLLNIREQMRKRQPRIGDPLNGIGYLNHEEAA